MTVATEAGYTWTDGKNARLLHAGNTFPIKAVTATEDSGSTADLVLNGLTRDRWVPFANEVVSPTDFSTADWTRTNVTVGSDGQTLTDDAVNDVHDVSQSYTFETDTYVIAAKVERLSSPFFVIFATDGTTPSAAFFDLRDGTLGLTISCTSKIVNLGNGKFLCIIIKSAAAGLGSISLRLASGGNGGDVIYSGSGDTLKIKSAIVHKSETTLRLDTFTAQAGTCFAIGAHNLWSSGASVAFIGGNRVVDGGFDVGVGSWVGGLAPAPDYDGTFALSGGKGLMTVTGAGLYYWEVQEFTTVIGRRYKVGGTISSGTGGTLYKIRVGPTNDMLLPGAFTEDVQNNNGTGEVIHTATSTTTYVILQVNGNGASAEFDDIFLKEYIVEETPTDDSPIMGFFDEVSYSEWSIEVSGGALPEVGVARIGDPLTFERPFYSGFTPARMNRATELVGNISRTGELLGRSKRRTILSENISFQHLTYDWVRANLDGPSGVIQSLEADSAFFAWRPEVTNDVAYLMRASTSAPAAMGIRDLWTFGINAEVYSYE